MLAHQKKIRELAAKSEASSNLFGEYWAKLNLSVSNAGVRQIFRKQAEPFILKYEWLGTLPINPTVLYGLFFDGVLAGVECFTENKPGIKFSFNGEPAICLARGACIHWAPSWAASYLITKSVALLPDKYAYVLAYADTDAGEIGTVYQSCNWFCTGAITNRYWVEPNGARHDSMYPRANLFSGRKAKLFTKAERVQALQKARKKMVADGWKLVQGGTRYRYVWPLGSGRERRTRIRYLQSTSVPYPKRAREQSMGIPDRPGSGVGSIPTPRSKHK